MYTATCRHHTVTGEQLDLVIKEALKIAKTTERDPIVKVFQDGRELCEAKDVSK